MRTLPLPLIALAFVAGCTVGPDYAGPPELAGNLMAAGAFHRKGDTPSLVRAPIAAWWETLADPELTALVQQALRASPTLAATQAKVRGARAGLARQRADGMPKANTQALYLHAHTPSDLLSGTTETSTDSDFVNVGFDAAWEADLFGGHRRAVEAAGAQAEARRYDLGDAQVSLAAEVARAYVGLRSAQERHRLTLQSIRLLEEMLALSRQRQSAGTAPAIALTPLPGQLATAQADEAELATEVEGYLDQLCLLTGQVPGSLDTSLGSDAPVPLPPAEVAVGDPAQLLRHRPDIRVAERTLAAATAQIGLREAEKFPRVSLRGLVGLGGNGLAALTHVGNTVALGTPSLSWTFLDFGRVTAAVDQATAERDAAEAQYRATVLKALYEAENALSHFGGQRRQLARVATAEAAAAEAADLTRQRATRGTASRLDLLDAERRQAQARIATAQATAALTLDYVVLQKSLGLGWSETQATAQAL
ncbi:efflux transporter outer membrane subunit [Nitrospirillum iridis]|uniref:NodT family efflux transporter outer membrane factor (OMF) lipoprotein n=1 Tax=Nitrospirillum iridis TaxID=765888 RepID=A0A7X0EGW8_9PROT|nr:efflux transporter outer membrane subunit [Nitrospirillum iridis]MBB6255375.1 NodT family efflux transporter outer membrane factor (OMF) lipoprotein [Nitrospirillum iridis]